MISIRVQNLTKRFGPVAALSGLNLEIRPGELFFLLGASGCGKTTLLRTLAGFHVPEEGSIRFDDEDVTRLPPHKRHAGMMFQNYALWPHMSVAENVAFGLEEQKVPRDEIRRRVAQTLESVRMGGYGDRRPAQLSGGQQQRVALARALVVRPRCLLLDEPLSNLDARLRQEMREEIRRVCKEFRLTTVYVTHDQKEALSIADRMAILDAGRVLQTGAPGEIYRRPASRFVAHFIGETNFISGRLAGSSGGRVTVDTAAGRFEGVLGNPESSPAAGSEVTVSIRPECWRIDGGRGATANVVRGIMGSTVYLGEIGQHQFEAGGVQFKAYELNPRPHLRAAGGEIRASVDPEDAVVLLE